MKFFVKLKKIGGSILTSMTELIFNSFLFKNFLAIPLEIPFDKLLPTNRNPYQINYVRSAIFHLEKKHNIFSISLTHKRKKEFQFSSSFPILLLILYVQTAGSK